MASFGDGATNIGAFHEAANLAAVWQLPVVFLCQNNGYGEHTSVARAPTHRARRPAGRGLRDARGHGGRQRPRGRLPRRVERRGPGPGRAGADPRRSRHLPALRARLRGPHGIRRSRRARRGVEAGAGGPLPSRARCTAACSPRTPRTPSQARCAALAGDTLAEVLELPEPDADEMLFDIVAPSPPAPAPPARPGGRGRVRRASGPPSPWRSTRPWHPTTGWCCSARTSPTTGCSA